jgi:hypothetical protein
MTHDDFIRSHFESNFCVCVCVSRTLGDTRPEHMTSSLLLPTNMKLIPTIRRRSDGEDQDSQRPHKKKKCLACDLNNSSWCQNTRDLMELEKIEALKNLEETLRVERIDALQKLKETLKRDFKKTQDTLEDKIKDMKETQDILGEKIKDMNNSQERLELEKMSMKNDNDLLHKMNIKFINHFRRTFLDYRHSPANGGREKAREGRSHIC